MVTSISISINISISIISSISIIGGMWMLVWSLEGSFVAHVFFRRLNPLYSGFEGEWFYLLPSPELYNVSGYLLIPKFPKDC